MTGASRFAQSCAEARDKFLAAARERGLGVESHLHPLPGRDGEALAMDVARDGPAHDATRRAIKRQIRDAFYADTDAWKQRIADQGVGAASGALRGLAGAG